MISMLGVEVHFKVFEVSGLRSLPRTERSGPFRQIRVIRVPSFRQVAVPDPRSVVTGAWKRPIT
jgi:hypothetical protein